MRQSSELRRIRKLHEDAERALRKAVVKALAKHAAEGVPAVVWRDGRVVKVTSSRQSSRRKKKIR